MYFHHTVDPGPRFHRFLPLNNRCAVKTNKAVATNYKTSLLGTPTRKLLLHNTIHPILISFQGYGIAEGLGIPVLDL